MLGRHGTTFVFGYCDLQAVMLSSRLFLQNHNFSKQTPWTQPVCCLFDSFRACHALFVLALSLAGHFSVYFFTLSADRYFPKPGFTASSVLNEFFNISQIFVDHWMLLQIVRIFLSSPFYLRRSNDIKALSKQLAPIRETMYKDRYRNELTGWSSACSRFANQSRSNPGPRAINVPATDSPCRRLQTNQGPIEVHKIQRCVQQPNVRSISINVSETIQNFHHNNTFNSTLISNASRNTTMMNQEAFFWKTRWLMTTIQFLLNI